MKKRPFLMALLLVGCIFIFFFLSVLVIAGLMGRSTAFPVGEKVGIVEVLGVIASSEELNEQLIDFRENDSVKAIVLRIDSPGGGVGPSQEIHEEVLKTAKVKPVVVSMASVAASGGYYVAAPAQKILANAGTITGSIGVIMEFTNIEGLLDKIGLKSQVVKSGDHKDIGSPTRPMGEAERAILQSMIDDVHDQFVSAVAEGRGMDTDKVESLADGRIFSGRQALQLGLVDELGNLQDAVRIAGELGGIQGEPEVVYPPEEKPRFLDYLMEQGATYFGKALNQRYGQGIQFLWQGTDRR